MSDHHDDLLLGLAAIREHVAYLHERMISMARFLTVLQRKIETLAADVAAEQMANDAIVTALHDIATDTSALAPPGRRRDTVQ